MNMVLKTCAFLLVAPTLSMAQSEPIIGCFVDGECTQSLYLEVSPAETPDECLEICQVL